MLMMLPVMLIVLSNVTCVCAVGACYDCAECWDAAGAVVVGGCAAVDAGGGAGAVAGCVCVLL